MKLFLKLLPLSLLTLNLQAEVFSAFWENDVIDGKDNIIQMVQLFHILQTMIQIIKKNMTTLYTNLFQKSLLLVMIQVIKL